MADLSLTQAEADVLIAVEKHRVNEDRYDFPMAGVSLSLPLQSSDKREQFLLDISRGRIDLLRAKYQNRARQVVVLVRVDVGGGPHRNPDGEDVPCPHFHTYREGYADKWAVPLPADRFRKASDLWTTSEDFMRYCNITKPLHIDRGLFT
ncbi:MAG: hypothetical protein EHM35_01110 [Planctomycetaceae bacterium]|nr:MAG: hypothetical protein EHM35_01110 [Planctomycetaceae bacterium]